MPTIHTFRAFAAGFLAGGLVILLSSSIAASREKNGGIAGDNCPADIAPPGAGGAPAGDGQVNVDDLLAVINAWGICQPSEDDADGDGWTTGQGDCDDNNPNVNPAAIETCNGIDDDCDGLNDEKLGSPDDHEPNDACIASTDLGSTANNEVIAFTGTLYPAGDHDFLRFFAVEQNGSVNTIVTATLTLTVPASSSSSFRLSARLDGCQLSFEELLFVQPGTTGTLTMEWEDQFGQDDSRDIFIEIRQLSPADGECQPYTLTLSSE